LYFVLADWFFSNWYQLFYELMRPEAL
jgi:hypothetical protein